MRPIKVAVVGTNIGCTLHVRALKAAGFEVAALVGRNREVTAARAAHFGIPRSLGSIEAVADSDVEAVVIATPPETHHEFVMKALAAGKHVLCEKPFSLDVAEAREMRSAAEAAGVANMVTHEFRWFAQNALMRQLVTSGRIGSPIQMTALFDHTLCAPATLDVPAWWRTHVGGGGWLRNYNAHGIDLIRYIAGDFAAVCGRAHAGSDRGMTSDDSYAAAFALKSGVQGVMAGSCRAWDAFASTRIIGSDATLNQSHAGLALIDAQGEQVPELPSDLAEALRGGGPAVERPQETLPVMEDTRYVQTHSSDYGFPEQVGLCSAFASWIRDPAYRNPAIATFADGVAHVEVIAAVERSQAEQRWIELG